MNISSYVAILDSHIPKVDVFDKGSNKNVGSNLVTKAKNRGYFEEIQMKKGIRTVEEEVKVVREFTNF